MITNWLLRFRIPVMAFISFALFASSANARHGEEDFISNRIPEPAPYVVSETDHPTLGSPNAQPGPPFENLWNTIDDVGACTGCHTTLFDHWNGAMMSNAWRDPGWRGAFLLVARLTSTDGCDDIPPPPDGSDAYDCSTPDRKINPFANPGGTSTFNLGTTTVTTSGSGSMMDDFCSRCHMPTDYVDSTVGVYTDDQSPHGAGATTQEHGRISPTFDPTSIDPGATEHPVDPYTGQPTPESFAERRTAEGRMVNSNSGKSGIVCEVCHTNVETRYTPYHNFAKSGVEYYPATTTAPRWNSGLTDNQEDILTPADAASSNLGYGIGAGAFRLSPHALNEPERFGPLSWNNFSGTLDTYLTDVFSGGGVTRNIYYIQANPPGKHDTFYHVKFERSEFCGACHDVTNPATIKNQFGFWVGGFPIERTYTEWLNSRYADRPGNPFHDADYKRDCMTCHMIQNFGEPGTALTLYTISGTNVIPDAPLSGPSCDRETRTPHWTHHFVGGNAYITRMIGADTTTGGTAHSYPELLHTSFSSKNPASRFHYARFDNAPERRGPPATQHERFAWDRLRNVLLMDLDLDPSTSEVDLTVTVSLPETGNTLVPLKITATNAGSGHNFPTGFPEGRVAWLAVRAFDLGTNPPTELQINDSVWNMDFQGVGYLTTATDPPTIDPNYPGCNWELPEGSPDPYAILLKAVATLDKQCPTLDLPYATPVNLIVDPTTGMPTDQAGAVIDRNNPQGLPRYQDLDADGDRFDDAFLTDTRLRPLPHAGATLSTSRYSVVLPSMAVGPIGVTAVVYYQSFEAIVAKKFLGNLANTDDLDADEGLPDGRPKLEPCVLKGLCDRIGKGGATGEAELREAMKFDPVVVEGAPPVPMEVVNGVIHITGAPDTTAPFVVINNSKNNPNVTAQIPANRHWSPSPYGGATGNFDSEGTGELNVDAFRIAKVTFSEPVQGVDPNTFYLTDNHGKAVTTLLDQIDDTTWALFPFTAEEQALLDRGVYVIHVAPSRQGSTITDFSGNQLAGGPAPGGEYTYGFKVGTNVPVPPTAGGPNPPTNLTATDAGTGGAINLTWMPSTSSGVTEQRLKRSTSAGGPYTTIQTFADNVTSSFADTGLTNATPYYYVITASDGTTESANSNEASATPSGGGADQAPQVASVDPADGASNVGRNTIVTVTFTEPVNVTSTGIALNQAAGPNNNPCATLGSAVAGTVAVGATQSVWRFTPAGILGSRTSYCVTVHASQVTDVDVIDPPDNMSANFGSSFKTGK